MPDNLTIESVQPSPEVQAIIDRMAAVKPSKKPHFREPATPVSDESTTEIKRRRRKAWKR
jgi:hypothetical protein